MQGVNAVLRSFPFRAHDRILYLNLAYGMVVDTLQYLVDTLDVDLVECTLAVPSSNEDIVAAVEATIARSAGSIRFATFSHITSTPAIVLPVDQLIALCRKHNITVLIDGAHCLGHLPLNLNGLQPDYYIANGHKWLFSPKGRYRGAMAKLMCVDRASLVQYCGHRKQRRSIYTHW